MRFQLDRLVTAAAVLSALVGCDAIGVLAPDDNPALTAGGSLAGDAPSKLAAIASSSGEIVVSWQDNSSTEASFELLRSTSGATGSFITYASTGPNITSFRDSTLTAQAQYCYVARAAFAKGKRTTYSSFSNVACATTPPVPPVPSAPTSTIARPVSSSAVTVAWTAATGSRDGFRVERSATAGGPWATAVSVGAAARSYDDAPLASDQRVCYRVTAYNGNGSSAPSNVACTSPPAAPTNLTARGDAQGILITWTDNSAVEDGYELRRSIGGVTEPTSWTSIATLPPNAGTYHDAGLQPGTSFWYAVRARKDNGSSDSIYARAIIAGAVPSAPQRIGVMPASSFAVIVSWSGVPDTRRYRIERSIDGGASWAVAGTDTLGYRAEFQDDDRTPEQPVWYRVIAFNEHGDSPSSPIGSTTPPAYPTDVVVVSIDGQTAEVRWTDNSSVEDGYEVVTTEPDCYEGGCYYDPIYHSYALPPNATSHRFNSAETLYGVLAKKDGGSSWWGFETSSMSAFSSRRPSGFARPPLGPMRQSLPKRSNPEERRP